MKNVRGHIPFFSRRRWGVKNHAPWKTIFQHTAHQFHENDLFTPAAAMSYFGLLTLFPALLVMLVIGNRFAAGGEGLGGRAAGSLGARAGALAPPAGGRVRPPACRRRGPAPLRGPPPRRLHARARAYSRHDRRGRTP